mmetsp:Transcript_113196/g.365746  ORF Transcript_113196/g.365746 Transcript_113196/m.365746 type:complete len:81 (-) Transcript_113196:3-245(-)
MQARASAFSTFNMMRGVCVLQYTPHAILTSAALRSQLYKVTIFLLGVIRPGHRKVSESVPSLSFLGRVAFVALPLKRVEK